MGAFSLRQGRVRVIVVNHQPTALRNLTVNYTGGRSRIPRLDPGAWTARHIRPSSESDLRMDWTDRSGRPVTKPIDCYFEPGYSGCISLEVMPGNKVVVVDKTEYRPFP